MVDVTVEGLPHSVNIVILDAELLTGPTYNGSDEGVVSLDDAGEQVVGGLVVEGTRKDVPEPAVCCIVLCGGHLQLSPEKEESNEVTHLPTDLCNILSTHQSLCTIISLGSGLGHSTFRKEGA